MNHATAAAAATHASGSAQAESAAIFAAFLIGLALVWARSRRKTRRERARHEAWRVTELASARRSLAAAEARRREFRGWLRNGTPRTPDDRHLLEQHRQDISGYRANVRDLENWPRWPR